MQDSKLGTVEEAEVPLEYLHGASHHQVERGGEKWIYSVALSTANLAVLAAITALISGDRANLAMMRQIESADQWAFYEVKGIKAAVLDAKPSLTGAVGKDDREKATKYCEQQKDIEKEARSKDIGMTMGIIGCVFLCVGFCPRLNYACPRD